MRCKECKRRHRINHYNNYEFSMDLYGGNPYPHQRLDFEVVSFFGSTDGDVCHSTFNLYLDKGLGKKGEHNLLDEFAEGEKVLCEDVSINQLERLYHFLDLVLNKTVKE
tara:strand:- start:243 stop:569 length:327 start_codon:yes stop_codon:yes gene_type:complete